MDEVKYTKLKNDYEYLSSVDLNYSPSNYSFNYPYGYPYGELDLEDNPFFNDKGYAAFSYREAINFEKNYKLPVITNREDIKITEFNTKTYRRPIIIVAPPVSGKTTYLSNNIVPRLVDMDWLYLSIMKEREYQVNLTLFKKDEEYFETVASIAEDLLEDKVFDCNQHNFYIGYLRPQVMDKWMKKGAIIVPFLIDEETHIQYMKKRSRHIGQFKYYRSLFIEYTKSKNMTCFSTIEEAVEKAKNLFDSSVYDIKFFSQDKKIDLFVYNSLRATKRIKRSVCNLSTTANYLFNTIGNFIHVKIENNKPSFVMSINEDLFLSDDCRLLSKTNKFHIFQLMMYRNQIIKLYTELCNNYRIPDMNILQNIGDFPCVRTDNKHPYKNRYKNKKINRPKHLVGVFSFCGSSKYADILMPTPDVISFIDNEGLYKDIVYNHDWSRKINKAVFRGSLNRCINIKDQRLKSHILSLQYPDYLDSRIVGYSKHPLVYGDGDELTFYNIKGLPEFNDRKNLLSFSEQTNYKYLLLIDGFVAAWRMVFLLHTKSVILKVDSKWKEYYYDGLKAWEHYIPIKKDLSNLISTIEWCRSNDEKCREIAENAYNFAITYLNKNKVYEYLANLLYSYQSRVFPKVKEKKNKVGCFKEVKVPDVKVKSLFDENQVKVEISKKMIKI